MDYNPKLSLKEIERLLNGMTPGSQQAGLGTIIVGLIKSSGEGAEEGAEEGGSLNQRVDEIDTQIAGLARMVEGAHIASDAALSNSEQNKNSIEAMETRILALEAKS